MNGIFMVEVCTVSLGFGCSVVIGGWYSLREGFEVGRLDLLVLWEVSCRECVGWKKKTAGWWAYFYSKVEHCVVTHHSEALWYISGVERLCHCYTIYSLCLSLHCVFVACVFVTSRCFCCLRVFDKRGVKLDSW